MTTTIPKWFSVTVLIMVLGVAAFFIAMRFHDGPRELISGGPFQTGEQVASPASWDFLKGRDVIEFQTLDPETSRTVWLGVLDGRLFIVSGYMNTAFGRLWKHWPHYLEDDNRIILRIDGKLYEQRLQRLMELDALPRLMSIYTDKYGADLASGASEADLRATLANGDFWLFEVVSR